MTGLITGRTGLRLASGLAVAGLTLLSGCGQDASPADQVPALSRTLDRVDEAVAHGQYDAARDSIDRLVATTVAARDDGDLEDGQADTILAAAARLRSALPAAPAEPSEPSEPSGTGTEPAPEESTAPEETSPTPAPAPSPEEKPGKPEKDKGKHKGH